MTTTNKNVLDTLKNAIITRTTEQDGEKKTKEVQQLLKSTNFSDRKVYQKYNHLCNLFIVDMQKALDADTNAEKPISKKTLLDRLNAVSAFLKYEGVQLDNAPLTFKNYHINFILNHALTLKIGADKTVTDTVKSETAIKRLIEQCFYFTLNNMPLPSVQISEKSLDRMSKLNLKIAEQEQSAGTVKKAEKPETENKAA